MKAGFVLPEVKGWSLRRGRATVWERGQGGGK